MCDSGIKIPGNRRCSPVFQSPGGDVARFSAGLAGGVARRDGPVCQLLSNCSILLLLQFLVPNSSKTNKSLKMK